MIFADVLRQQLLKQRAKHVRASTLESWLQGNHDHQLDSMGQGVWMWACVVVGPCRGGTVSLLSFSMWPELVSVGVLHKICFDFSLLLAVCAFGCSTVGIVQPSATFRGVCHVLLLPVGICMLGCASTLPCSP